MLDVGCGVGRTAVWLAPHLTKGSYEGFDVSAEAIAWCQREITPRCPAFRFTHIDLANAAYNPRGALRADEFTFPYPEEEFDLVCLFSVFTHLMPPDFTRYVSEIRRVLKDGGRMHATFFLLTPERITGLEQSDHGVARSLWTGSGPAKTAYESAEEWMVAYEEDFARRVIHEEGLRLGLVKYGTWPDWAKGLEELQGPQDTVVAYRA